jgi:hypothetical protein
MAGVLHKRADELTLSAAVAFAEGKHTVHLAQIVGGAGCEGVGIELGVFARKTLTSMRRLHQSGSERTRSS